MNPREKIAEQLGCDIRLVHIAFQPESIPELLTREFLDDNKELVELYHEISANLAKTLRKFRQLPEDERQLLRENGFIGIEELDALHGFLNATRASLTHIGNQPRPGGFEPAGDVVARGIARAFVLLRKPIKFGHTNDKPNTEFGRAVEFAFKCFRVKVGWRGPAERAKAAFERNPMLWRRAPDTNSTGTS